MKNSLPKALEIVWLITAVLCFLTAIHQTIFEGISKSYLFFIFSLVALIIYLLRRQMRKSNQNSK